ncbi:regulator of volume decrease after cellular swelling-domain-containing protein [Rhexocercosporidium sp. MPI-PUGE-AT-0058]|nr:regulator of volume decrease after cellular swelling-domain-containing protein [Rhexocercosporidium sp. MPI-PUGE-AT-0058]
MPPTTIRTAPSEDTFTSLAEHQAQTPSTFYNAKPVLHYQKNGIRAIASVDQISKLPILGQPEAGDAATTVQSLDVWISSESLTLFNTAISTGMSIPYPSISLHAIQRLDDPSAQGEQEQIQGLYMQLDLSDPNSGGGGEEDEMDEDTAVELTLLTTPDEGETPAQAIQKMFDAVSNCSNLHPDPAFEGDEEMGDGEGGDSRIVFEGSVGYDGISGLPGVQQGAGDGGLPPPFPGSGGWITAENVGEYFDEDGNWIGGANGGGEGEGLGEGAGRVRTREERDGEVDGNGNGINGTGAEGDESKRPRTE